MLAAAQGAPNWYAVLSNAAIVIVALGGFYKYLMRGLGSMIDDRVHPRLETVTAALTTHMETETAERKRIAKALRRDRKKAASVNRMLEERNAVLGGLQEKLDAHMAHDEAVLKQAADALATGQTALISRIDDQHAESVKLHHELSATVQAHVISDESAFTRIETTLKEKS